MWTTDALQRSSRGTALVRCSATAAPEAPLQQLTAEEPLVEHTRVTAFAPATVANLGPGFDFLGCAVEGLGDHVTAEVRDDLPGGTVVIDSIQGDNGRLSLVAEDNCVGIAAIATLQLLGVNAIFGSPLTKAQLVLAGLKSEAAVSGYHADNVAPAILGGFVLIRSYEPLELISLPYPAESRLFFVISMGQHVANSSQAAALVSAILRGDTALLGSALASDKIVEPRRGPLIPGLAAVKVAAHATGAFGCTISGAGPTAIAVTDSRTKGEKIGKAMVEAFLQQGKLQATYSVQALDRVGARTVSAF
eukprot:jgi/Mesen1/6497/ME000332S05504